MQVNYAVYITSTGEVLQNGSCDDTMVALQAQSAGETAIDTGEIVVDSKTQYYVAGVLTPRPLLTSVATWDVTSIVADGVSTATLGPGLPNPSTVIMEGSIPDIINKDSTYRFTTSSGIVPAIDEVTDGSYTITTTTTGLFTIIVESFPYQTYTTTISGT